MLARGVLTVRGDGAVVYQQPSPRVMAAATTAINIDRKEATCVIPRPRGNSSGVILVPIFSIGPTCRRYRSPAQGSTPAWI